MQTSNMNIYNVTAVKNGYVAHVSHHAASSEADAIDTAKMYAIPGQVKGANWIAEFVREAS